MPMEKPHFTGTPDAIMSITPNLRAYTRASRGQNPAATREFLRVRERIREPNGRIHEREVLHVREAMAAPEPRPSLPASYAPESQGWWDVVSGCGALLVWLACGFFVGAWVLESLLGAIVGVVCATAIISFFVSRR